MTDAERARLAAGHFSFPGPIVTVGVRASGHINDSFLVRCSSPDGHADFLLQRVNRAVFSDAVQVISNVQRVLVHLEKKLAENASGSQYRVMNLVQALDGMPFWQDDMGEIWRVYELIPNARSFEFPPDRGHAYEAARAFGTFQNCLADMSCDALHETIPDFHDTGARLKILVDAVDSDPLGRAREARMDIDFALKHTHLAELFEQQGASGDLPRRVTHNDAKINNVLFHEASAQAVCVVDLDTTMPGLSLYDFGDMMRSMTTRLAEDAVLNDPPTLDMEMFRSLAAGYLETVGAILTKTEKSLLASSGQVITFEQGVRFLTDFLEGDRYFRTNRPGQNLVRCRSQFMLLRAMKRQETQLQRIMGQLV